MRRIPSRRTIKGLMLVGLLVGTVAAAARAQEPAAPAPAVAAATGSGRIAAGDYVEIDEAGQPNGLFTLTIKDVTPNIIHFRGKYGWVTFASFDAAKKEYRGFFEWQEFPGARSPGGKWADLYQVRVVLRDGIVRLEGKSPDNEILIRARPTREVPGANASPAPPPPTSVLDPLPPPEKRP